jgi:1-deoxy-D-xylulose 5-phosphate reductoisomerase
MLNSIDETASCTVFNAADEIAVEKFKNSKINWDQIYPFVESATEKFSSSRVSNIDDIFELDTLVRKTLLED